MTNLKNKLVEEMTVFGSDLRGVVAESVLNNVDDHSNEDIMTFLRDVSQYGCISGCVSGMIYYYETVEFFDNHHSHLEDLLIEYGMDNELELVFCLKYANDEEEIEELENALDICVTSEKNRLAWLMYESVIFDLLNDYECELAC
jgi:hypothetical protein